MPFFARVLIFVVLMGLIELYFLQAVRTFVQGFSQTTKTTILAIAYTLAGLTIITGIAGAIVPPPQWPAPIRMVSGFLLIFTICKLLASSFLIIDDIIRFFRWVFSFLSKPDNVEEVSHKIPRLKFLSQIAVGFAAISVSGFFYGIIRGAYKYRVHKVKIPSSNLPPAFDGFKIVQLSDIHTGSFNDNNALKKAFSIVMEQNADLILFTGDLVNNESIETEGFQELYASLKAPHGVYSVLGNHDYGDYVQWDSAEAKKENLETLKKIQANAGWRLLLNEHVPIEKDGQTIGLLGIENWGGKMNFPKYGRMDLAHKGSDIYPFKILMSHDPSHFEKEVSVKYKDIDLTLSGHTHGMQLGIEIPNLKWSPAKFFYKYWAGLYKEGEQFVYVNRGLGFLGYPGRLGIWPEITVIELQKV